MAFTPVRPNDPLDQPSHSGLHNQHSQDIDDINEAQTLQDEKITDLEALNATLAGGNAGEVLGKSTNDDYDWEWIPAPTGGDGGDTYPGISTEQPNGLGIGTDGGLQVDPATLLSDADGQYLTLDDEGKIYSETLPPVPGKNLLYNGAMQVHQRGTSKTGLAVGGQYYTADRWSLRSNLAALDHTWTEEVVADGPDGFGKSLRHTATVGGPATYSVSVCQFLEGQDFPFPVGTPMTLSFWVKTSKPGTYRAGFDSSNFQNFTVSAANTWEKVSLSNATERTYVQDNTRGPEIRIYLVEPGDNVTAGFTFAITGVQLEVGETATEFEHKKYGTELLECKRYYQQIGEGMVGHTQNANLIEVLEKFEVQMRTDPTVNVIPGREASIRQAVAGATDQKAPTPSLIAPSGTKDSLWTIVDGFTGLTGWVSCTSRGTVGTAFMEASAEL